MTDITLTYIRFDIPFARWTITMSKGSDDVIVDIVKIGCERKTYTSNIDDVVKELAVTQCETRCQINLANMMVHERARGSEHVASYVKNVHVLVRAHGPEHVEKYVGLLMMRT
jgi:hypothetical protein